MKLALSLIVGSMAVASVIPLGTSANEKAVDACAMAYVDQHVPAGHPTKIVSRVGSTTPRGAILANERIKVVARGAQSRKHYGSATCIVGRNGELLAMEVTAPRTRLAKARASTPAARG